MKLIKQLLIILLFCALGELMAHALPLPVPAAIYGLVLLLIALCAGIVKPEHIAQCSKFLIDNMGLLFVAPGVKLLQYWDIIAPDAAAIILICVVSTWVVFAAAGLVTQWLLRKKEAAENG